MAAVKNRSFATGLLALAGLAAAGIAFLGKAPETTQFAGDIPAPESTASDSALELSVPVASAESASPSSWPNATAPVSAPSDAADPDVSLQKPIEKPSYDRRRLAMSGSAKEIEAARRNDRVGTFRTVMPADETGRGIPNPKFAPTLGLDSGARLDLRRDLAPGKIAASASAAAPGPIEFIVKLNDPRLVKDLQREFAKSPEAAARRMKSAMGNGKIVQRARLQGFTLGGEAILKFEGPRKMDDFGKAHDEIQSALSAAPGVAYAEQNYTADINSAQ